MSGRQGQRATSDVINVIERARGREEHHVSSRIFSIALMLVFFIALMGCLAAGALVYRAAAEAQEQALDLHLESGLLVNTVRAYDLADAVSLGEGPEGTSLVLTRTMPNRVYETRIYQYQGHVLQETTIAERPYSPEGATELLETAVFDVSLEDDLITFETDSGSFCVALRSTTDGATGTRKGGDA